MFLASNASLSLTVCLPGPPVSSTGKTPECKRQADKLNTTKKYRYSISWSNKHIYWLLQWAAAGDNQGHSVCETWTTEKKKQWILIGFVYMLANTESNDTAHLCCVVRQLSTNLRTGAGLYPQPKWMKPLSEYLENMLLGARKQSCGQTEIADWCLYSGTCCGNCRSFSFVVIAAQV